MTRLEKLIGFPVPQEHRQELNERLNTYDNCDRTTLISLLLQYDWELLRLRENTQEKIILEVFRTKPSAEEMKIAAQKFHNAVEKMNGTFREEMASEEKRPFKIGDGVRVYLSSPIKKHTYFTVGTIIDINPLSDKPYLIRDWGHSEWYSEDYIKLIKNKL